jgi:L-lactate permease
MSSFAHITLLSVAAFLGTYAVLSAAYGNEVPALIASVLTLLCAILYARWNRRG